MKRFNKYSLLFAFVIVFIVYGVWGNCFEGLKLNALDMLRGVKHLDFQMILDSKANIDDVSGKELRYHDGMITLNSVRENLMGTRVVEKDDTTVIKADSGSLVEQVYPKNEEELGGVAAIMSQLQAVAEENGAEFLYCAAPKKEYYEVSPPNTENAFKENYEGLLSELDKAGVPFIDLSEVLERGIPAGDMFYLTDHHWTARSGFMAAAGITEELGERYGFERDEAAADINNYDVTLYNDWFLGSKGKKVGKYFTWSGADDFELIVPGFRTDMTEEQPLKNKVRSGDFSNTVLYMENMEKDYYNINTYATYSGGDFRIQIIRNNLKPDGKKIVIIRDSFACVVTPFLSLQTGELHVCDVREGGYVGEKPDMEEYIKREKPDYVIVLYSGVALPTDSKYDFF